jgi:hypothetical protein
MKTAKVNQYSVFLLNEAGALKKFAQTLYDAGLDIVGISSDIRYEAAVVKFIVAKTTPDAADEPDISRVITRAGYTSVKTEVLCVEEKGREGLILELSSRLCGAGINIASIYGCCVNNKHGKLFFVVDNIERALEILNKVS